MLEVTLDQPRHALGHRRGPLGVAEGRRKRPGYGPAGLARTRGTEARPRDEDATRLALGVRGLLPRYLRGIDRPGRAACLCRAEVERRPRRLQSIVRGRIRSVDAGRQRRQSRRRRRRLARTAEQHAQPEPWLAFRRRRSRDCWLRESGWQGQDRWRQGCHDRQGVAGRGEILRFTLEIGGRQDGSLGGLRQRGQKDAGER